LLSGREVVDLLRICTATVCRLCQRRELGYLRIPDAVGVPEAALRAFMESRRRAKPWMVRGETSTRIERYTPRSPFPSPFERAFVGTRPGATEGRRVRTSSWESPK